MWTESKKGPRQWIQLFFKFRNCMYILLSACELLSWARNSPRQDSCQKCRSKILTTIFDRTLLWNHNLRTFRQSFTLKTPRPKALDILRDVRRTDWGAYVQSSFHSAGQWSVLNRLLIRVLLVIWWVLWRALTYWKMFKCKCWHLYYRVFFT